MEPMLRERLMVLRFDAAYELLTGTMGMSPMHALRTIAEALSSGRRHVRVAMVGEDYAVEDDGVQTFSPT